MELSKYLLPSHSVEVTVSVTDENNKASNLILKSVIEKGYIDGTFKIIAPVYHGRVYNFQVDELVLVTFNAPNIAQKEYYSVNCRVKQRNLENTQSTLTLEVIGVPAKVQRRQAFRVNIYNTYSFNYKGQFYELFTKDISSNGMLALSTVQLGTNAVLEILFDANPKPIDSYGSDYSEAKVFKVRCKVIDSIPQVEIRRYLNRIKFEGLTDQESKYLIQYLYAKQTEILHMDPTASEKIAAFFEKPLDEAIDFNSKSYKNLQIVSLISVLPLFISIVMLLFSRPKKMYVLDYFFDFYRPQYWNQAYLLGALIMAILLIGIDVFGLYLNLQEIKKENRTIHWSLIVTLFIAIAIVLFILIVSFINDIPLF
ncbi:MAG TPA: hypothetical protein DCS67_10395 [Clostridiales bacterium UBA8960]|nr:hypothetical protein [Clostridiales bacterium UBA8960]